MFYFDGKFRTKPLLLNYFFFKVNRNRVQQDSWLVFRSFVVYLDQRTGALHTVRWSKSFFSELKHIFLSFSVTNRKKKGKCKKDSWGALVCWPKYTSVFKAFSYLIWKWLKNLHGTPQGAKLHMNNKKSLKKVYRGWEGGLKDHSCSGVDLKF